MNRINPDYKLYLLAVLKNLFYTLVVKVVHKIALDNNVFLNFFKKFSYFLSPPSPPKNIKTSVIRFTN